MNRKLVPILKDRYCWVGEHINDDDYFFCPICDEQVGINDHIDSKCSNCGQLLDNENYYDYGDTGYYKQLYEMATDKIHELQEQLKGAIVPKFKVNQMVYTIRHKNSIYHTRIDEIHICEIKGKQEIFYAYDSPGSYRHEIYSEDCFFATKEEAEKKLAEMRGE